MKFSKHLARSIILCSASILLLLAGFWGCSSGLQMQSFYREREIAIDGDLQDWEGALQYIEKKHVMVGFYNDGEFLYVGFKTADRSIRRRIFALGLTLWFDNQGGREKRFGIRFPIGMMEQGGLRPRQFQRREWQSGGADSLQQRMAANLRELEIIPGKDETPIRMSISELKGLDIKLGTSNYDFEYELRIPLQRSTEHPYAVSGEQGQTIGVGFETGEFSREEFRAGRGRAGFPGARRPGSFGGRRPSGFGAPQTEPLELWVKVKLTESASR